MEMPSTKISLTLLAGLLALLACVNSEGRYSTSEGQQPVADPQFHFGFHVPGMCLTGKSCDSCPSDRKTSLYRMRWVGWLKYKKVEQTVCCPNCGGNLKYTQNKEDYMCMCPPVESCWRGDDCDGCDDRYVTKIYGRKYCCKNCMAASINLNYNMGMMDTCDCNIPVDGGRKGKREMVTEVPESEGSGEELH